MPDLVLDEVRARYRSTHDTLLDVARKTDAASFDKPFGTANSVAFNLWHVARWDDSLFPDMVHAVPALAAALGAPEQLWVRERIGERWGLPVELGGGGAGTGLPTDDAHGLALPDRDELLSYAGRVFAEFSASLDRIDSRALGHRVKGMRGERSLASWLLYYGEHAARHLGMMEALRGAFGESGSARG